MSRQRRRRVRRGARQADGGGHRADRRPCGQEARRDGAGPSRRRSPRRRWSSSAAATASCQSNVDHFVGTDTVFAVLPLGTANSFARTLGHPARPRRRDRRHRQRAAAADRPRLIDGDYFVNAAALGLSPLIADTVPHGLKQYLGMVGYLLWAVRVGVQVPAVPAGITLDDGRHRDRVWATEARIANGTHHGGVELIERPDARQRRDRHPGGDRQEPVGAWRGAGSRPCSSCAGAS